MRTGTTCADLVLVRRVLQTVEASVPLTTVHAARSKQARAEPTAALHEQGRVHHAGVFPELIGASGVASRVSGSLRRG